MTSIISASDSPALPLLLRTNDEDEWPTYTGPLGVARLLVGKTEHVVERCQYGGKWGAFIAHDPEAQSVMEFAVSYESAEDALRRALGVHFTRLGFDAVSLGVALRHAALEQITALDAVAPAF
jgi:predicted RNase H-like HicB family nuclease